MTIVKGLQFGRWREERMRPTNKYQPLESGPEHIVVKLAKVRRNVLSTHIHYRRGYCVVDVWSVTCGVVKKVR